MVFRRCGPPSYALEAFLGNANGLLQGLVGGWQLSGITQALSGSPFSPSFNTSVQGSVAGRPDVVPGVPLYPGTPGRQIWDASLSKRTMIGEKASLLVKFEAFSVFNHPWFNNPAANISNTATVGRINGGGGERTCQSGAKLQF